MWSSTSRVTHGVWLRSGCTDPLCTSALGDIDISHGLPQGPSSPLWHPSDRVVLTQKDGQADALSQRLCNNAICSQVWWKLPCTWRQQPAYKLGYQIASSAMLSWRRPQGAPHFSRCQGRKTGRMLCQRTCILLRYRETRLLYFARG